MKKVLVITYYWPPAGGAGVQRWLKFAKYLPEFGVQPIILTVDENKATYPQTDSSLVSEVPSGIKVVKTSSFEPLKLYGNIFGKDKIPYGGFANVSQDGFLASLSRYIRGNFFIPDARKGWNKYAIEAAYKLIEQHQIKTIITTGPPHSTHLVGLALKYKLDIKWIADFRDPWSDIYYNDQLQRTNWAQKKDELLEKKVLQQADVVVANCLSNSQLLKDKVVSKAQFATVENGFDALDFNSTAPSNSKVFKLVYTGTMAASYAPEVLLNALKSLKAEGERFEFHLAGHIDSTLLERSEGAFLKNEIILHGYLPHNKSVELLLGADCLVNIFPVTGNDKGIPGKLFEYLAARKPVINIGPKDGDAARILEECNAGMTFLREEGDLLKEHLNRLMADYGSHETLNVGNEQVNNYTRRSLTEKYVRLMESVEIK